jgi:hypothetical protein
MEFDPRVRAACPQMTQTRYSHFGYPKLSQTKQNVLFHLTQQAIDARFGGDIGQDAMKINFHACAVEIKTSKNPGSVHFALNTLLEGMQDVTLKSISKFTQREGTVFIELKVASGTRQFIFNPLPFFLPARLFLNPKTNAVDLEFILLDAPKNSRFYLCFGELETYRCAKCGVCAQTMRKCAKCMSINYSIRYCSRECQTAHWPTHKKYCCGRE